MPPVLTPLIKLQMKKCTRITILLMSTPLPLTNLRSTKITCHNKTPIWLTLLVSKLQRCLSSLLPSRQPPCSSQAPSRLLPLEEVPVATKLPQKCKSQALSNSKLKRTSRSTTRRISSLISWLIPKLPIKQHHLIRVNSKSRISLRKTMKCSSR
jgi:hypothetical protein